MNPKCDHCGTIMVEKTKKETGTIYYACPKWKKDGSGCPGGIKFPEKKPKAPTQDDTTKKLNQILYLLTGVHPDHNKEEFEAVLKDEFGQGLIRRTIIREIPTGEPPAE